MLSVSTQHYKKYHMGSEWHCTGAIDLYILGTLPPCLETWSNRSHQQATAVASDYTSFYFFNLIVTIAFCF